MNTEMAVQMGYEKLEGSVERIRFRNEQNGFTIAVLTPGSQGETSASGGNGKYWDTGKDPIVVKGIFGTLNVGESMELYGKWVNDPKWGRQFEVKEYEVTKPRTLIGIENYLASGVIKGIGRSVAADIVATFGLQTFDIIAKEPKRLTEVPGIGKKRAEKIHQHMLQATEYREVFVKLGQYGLTPNLIMKVFKEFKDEMKGPEIVRFVESNPYALIKRVWGIGFKKADDIGRRLGLPTLSPDRLSAGLSFCLTEASEAKGHVFLPKQALLKEVQEVLEFSQEELEGKDLDQMLLGCLDKLAEAREVIIDEKDNVYLAPAYYVENKVAEKLRELAGWRYDIPLSDEEIKMAEEAQGIELAEKQKEVVRQACVEGVLVLTGGPGTGKTTTIRTIIKVLEAKGLQVALMAPTGRAAKRMSEATRHLATTIHRALGVKFNKETGRTHFEHDEHNPLDADVVVVDECSMIDQGLANSLLKAVASGTKLILVGDADQLPSVGTGNFLKDVIDSGIITVVRLKEIFRQAQQSMIIVNAHIINSGHTPKIDQDYPDFRFVEMDDPTEVRKTIESLWQEVARQRGFDPVAEIQVLSPMYRSEVGVTLFNQEMQEILNPPSPSKPEYRSGFTFFRQGDKVMQIRNNYHKEVFNGDLGRITRIDPEDEVIEVTFFDGERPVEYDFCETDELVLAYAMTIHKSQGSEVDVVLIPVTTQTAFMNNKNLLYTAVTRAKKLVVMCGTKRALQMAVHKADASRRFTRLAEKIACGVEGLATDGKPTQTSLF